MASVGLARRIQHLGSIPHSGAPLLCLAASQDHRARQSVVHRPKEDSRRIHAWTKSDLGTSATQGRAAFAG